MILNLYSCAKIVFSSKRFYLILNIIKFGEKNKNKNNILTKLTNYIFATVSFDL
jgi:hypothetical protein